MTTLATVTLALAASNGPAIAQTHDSSKKAAAPASVRPGVDFRASKWLSDREVVNDNGEKIANVADLILDRGSGRIDYLVVKTGTTLGLGGKTVAIPYSAFRWDGKDENFLLASTTEQLKKFPEFSAKEWSSMMESKGEVKSDLRDRMAADAAASTDPYLGSLDTAKRSRVEGEITQVDRVRSSGFGEQVVITIKTSDGSTQKVTLGPSWFVNGSAVVPMRGDKVVVETLGLARETEPLSVATHLNIADRKLHLRGSDGSPAWALEAVESDGRTYCTPYWRNLLLSNLRGMKVLCHGNECGKVNDIILDRRSGEIGFLSIDPDQNYLGFADTKRLVPWTVSTVALDGTVRIDASKEMVIASPVTPSDVMALNNGATSEMVYNAYKVASPKFEPPKQTSPISALPTDAWSAKGLILKSVDHKSNRTISGQVVDFTTVKFDGDTQPAKALKIKVGNMEETILLGPVWYLDKQKLAFAAGDQVTVDTCKITINGTTHWIANSVDSNGTKVVLLDGNKGPAWDTRGR